VDRECLPDEHEPRDLGVDLSQLPRGDGRDLVRVRIGDEARVFVQAEAEMLGILIIRSSVTVLAGYRR